jgi:hypothetical protein
MGDTPILVNSHWHWWNGYSDDELSPDERLEKYWAIARNNLQEKIQNLHDNRMASLRAAADLVVAGGPSVDLQTKKLADIEYDHQQNLLQLDLVINDTNYFANKSYNPKALRDHHKRLHDASVERRPRLVLAYDSLKSAVMRYASPERILELEIAYMDIAHEDRTEKRQRNV